MSYIIARINPNLKERVESIARIRGISVSALVLESVRVHIDGLERRLQDANDSGSASINGSTENPNSG